MKVAIVDDMLLVRQGLATLLRERGLDIAFESASTDGLDQLVDVHAPDAIILDIRMPPTFTDEGLVAAAELRHRHPTLAILVLSQYLESSYALRLLHDAPARIGYLLKDRVMDIATVVDAIRRLTEGETVIDPTIVSRLIGRHRTGNEIASMTPREREVLALVAEGLSNRAIAQRLAVTERTVETHTAQIFQKLGLEPSVDAHRRVLAVLTFLRTAT